jgi:hypothetical protein
MNMHTNTFMLGHVHPHYAKLGDASRGALRSRGLLYARNIGKPFYAATIAVDGFNSIYGLPWVLDAFIYHPVKAPSGFALDAKFQGTGGSIDEKLPFAVLSLQHIADTTGAITGLYLDAQGARPQAVQWAADACKQRGIHFFDSPASWDRFRQIHL